MKKNNYSWLTISQWAKREGVARNTVLQWIDQNRVDVWSPAKGIKLIRNEEKRPAPMRPWGISRLNRISHEEM